MEVKTIFTTPIDSIEKIILDGLVLAVKSASVKQQKLNIVLVYGFTKSHYVDRVRV